jgi:hypothetical protein
MQEDLALSTWRILDINHQDNMVVLVSASSPTVKHYSAPSTIDRAEVLHDSLNIYCEDGVAWSIRISDGSRRKL